MRSLGADEIIDYRSVTLPTYLSKNFGGDKMFDIVVDTQGDTKLYGASGGFLKVCPFFEFSVLPFLVTQLFFSLVGWSFSQHRLT